jgi:hypothetical protein
MISCCSCLLEPRVTLDSSHTPCFDMDARLDRVARQKIASNMACEQHHNHHYRQEPNNTARRVTPSLAVWPVRNYTEQGENQDDQEHHS